jgi:hypothetical protein
VDFSLVRLFGVPTVALLAGGALSIYVSEGVEFIVADWQTGVLKSAVFLCTYGVVLLLGEFRQFVKVTQRLRRRVVGKGLARVLYVLQL